MPFPVLGNMFYKPTSLPCFIHVDLFHAILVHCLTRISIYHTLGVLDLFDMSLINYLSETLAHIWLYNNKNIQRNSMLFF